MLAFQPGEKLLPNVFERDGRAPSESVEAFVEFLEPRQTCGAVDVASWVRARAARTVRTGACGLGRGSGSGAS